MSKKYVDTGRKNQKLETRNKILASAQSFLSNGLEPNLEDVAKETGISRATIYRYFSNSDVLAAEAALDVSTKSPKLISKNLKELDIDKKVLAVQEYYNRFALEHENLFRKYISTVLSSNNATPKRGGRRKKTLNLVLEDANFNKKEKEDLSNLLTIFMGIEPLIVTKDVCNLNNEQSIKLLKWGMELLLKGFLDSKK